MELTIPQVESARTALLGPHANQIIDLLFGLVLHERAAAANENAEKIVRELGLVDGAPMKLTPLGYRVGDSIREYVFWVQRDRRLPCEGRVRHLSADYFARKSLLEVGCGMGSNLMSLSKSGARVIGVEPVSVYRQLSKILFERERMGPLEIVPGTGEALPFADGSFDVVLCISAHQYMDVRKALQEMTRVLAPGGELLIVGGTLDTYVIEGFRRVAKGSLRALKDYAVTITNTVTYSAVSRRAIGNKATGTTAFPIYPLKGTMAHWLSDCGLQELRSVERIHPESCFSYKKPDQPASYHNPAQPTHRLADGHRDAQS